MLTPVSLENVYFGAQINSSHYETSLSRRDEPEQSNILVSTVFDRAEALDRIESITLLPENWDGYGADQIDSSCIENTKHVLSMLPNYVPSPEIYPNPNGTITMDWGTNDKSLSIEIGNNNFSSFLETDRGVQTQ